MNENDLISRKSVLDAFENADADVCEEFLGGADWGFGINNIKDIISKIPAQNKKSGKWIFENKHTVSKSLYFDDNYHSSAKCSECNYCVGSINASFGFQKIKTYPYCPNCRSKMEEA